jgi:prepilin-type processing-associated H-X9-DG protein
LGVDDPLKDLALYFENNPQAGFSAPYSEELQALITIAMAKVVPVFVCPADPRGLDGSVGPPVWFLPWGPSALSSYLGVAGSSYRHDDGYDSFDGFFGVGAGYWDGFLSFRGVTDGLSNTLMIGERPPPPAQDLSQYYINGRFFDALFTIGPWFGNSRAFPTYADCTSVYYFSPGDLKDPCHAMHFWSFHSGGGNWLLCDGSVRFISYTAGTTVIPDMASIAGGEVIPPLD